MSKYPANSEVNAARSLARSVAAQLRSGSGLAQANPSLVKGLARDLDQIAAVLEQQGDQRFAQATRPILVRPLADPRRPAWMTPAGSAPPTADGQTPAIPAPVRKPDATDSIAQRAGNLIDEIDFPQFVAGLVNGTFDAMVDAAIRQLESFADLISAVAKTVDQFVAENVSVGETYDWLVKQHPQDLALDTSSGSLQVVPKIPANTDEPHTPTWLADYGAAGEELSQELIDERIIPAARHKVGEGRQQLLATMVLLGLNRIVVREGSITARVRFRAAATDSSKVGYAATQDPQGQGWASRGSDSYQTHVTKVSTVGVNVQSDSNLRADLYGEVRLTFASETLPLDRFVDSAKLALLQRNARPAAVPMPTPPATPAPVVSPPPAATGDGGEL